MERARTLVEFLDQLRRLLSYLVEQRESLLPGYLREAFANAWSEVEKALRRLEQEVVDRENHHGLRRAGLTDVQLDLKLQGFNAATANLDLTQAPRAQGGWLIRKVKKALRWSNVILGSLASVLPGADLVKEYKEAGEIGLDEAIEQENEPRPYLR